MGLRTRIVRDAWGRKGGEFGTKNVGICFFLYQKLECLNTWALKIGFPLKLSCISSVFRRGPGFFL